MRMASEKIARQAVPFGTLLCKIVTVIKVDAEHSHQDREKHRDDWSDCNFRIEDS